MSRKRSLKSPGKHQIVPLRLPPDMRKEIRAVADRARLSDADIMRLAIERGIGSVEKMFERPEEQATAA